MTDWGEFYREHERTIHGEFLNYSEEQLATTVPATPAWTVRDVLAHLAGGADDMLTGRLDNVPGPEWTARHVGERMGFTVDELVSELRSNADALIATFPEDGSGPAIAFDIAVHHVDVAEALGSSQAFSDPWLPVLEEIAPRMLGELPLTITAEGSEIEYGGGGMAVTVPAYELFRALFSRRSVDQIAAWGWPLTDEQIAGLCIFGPREDAQPLPD